jgi:hypothetical protein
MENLCDKEFCFDIVKIHSNKSKYIIILTLCHFDRHHH